MHEDLHFFRAGTDQLAKPIDQVGQGDSPVTSSVNSPEKLSNRPNVTFSDVGPN
jgi:hypothetical protein